MASYNELNALIDAYINRNGVQAITGQILNGVLKAMVEQLGRGYTIMGAATPTTDPGTPDGPECYFASETGTYTDFDGLQVAPGELALLCYTPSDGWTKATIYEGFQEVGATIDGNVGTPSVGVSYADGVLSFDFHNMKGEPGQNGQDGNAAGFGTIGADITGGVGTPGVTVESSGPATAKNLQFHFTNLKGETGVTSVVATVDNTTGTPACTVSLVGQQLTLAFSGLKGAQGNTGSSVDYPFTIVNNLTTNDAIQALSAAMGVQLESEVSQLEAKVDGLDVNVGTWSVGSVNNPSGGHIPDYSSNRRVRTAELTIPLTAKYFFKVNSGYKFGIIVVGKRESLIWDSELSIDLQQGDVYRIVLREDPDPTNTNIYSGWTQEQIDALIASSGFDMFVKSSFDELKEELEAEINAVAITAIKSEQYCEIDVPIWPRPNSYIQDGLVFFLDGKDFTSGNWVDKIGNSSFAMNNCVKDGDGVKFNGTNSYGTTEDNLSFPSQSYTIEMVIKGEKEVSASSDSQIIFNTKNSGDFSLGFGRVGSAKLYTFQAGTTKTNLGYKYSSAVGFKRVSVNKDKCVVNGEPITAGGGVGNWSVGAKVVVGANASNTNWFFKGTIYAIRIYNRLLSENEMKANQMFDLDYYNL